LAKIFLAKIFFEKLANFLGKIFLTNFAKLAKIIFSKFGVTLRVSIRNYETIFGGFGGDCKTLVTKPVNRGENMEKNMGKLQNF